MKDVTVLSNDRPVLSSDGITTPTQDKWRVGDNPHLSLREWGVWFYEQMYIVPGTDQQTIEQYRQFYCGSRATHFRAKNKLREKGYLS